MLVISSASLADKHNIESALAYAAMGWQVFPAPPDSKKSYKSEQRSGAKWGMTGDPVEIRADFTRWPNARIGIPTGSVNGIVVIDVDTVEGHGVDGFAARRELEAKHGQLPETRRVLSPRWICPRLLSASRQEHQDRIEDHRTRCRLQGRWRHGHWCRIGQSKR